MKVLILRSSHIPLQITTKFSLSTASDLLRRVESPLNYGSESDASFSESEESWVDDKTEVAAWISENSDSESPSDSIRQSTTASSSKKESDAESHSSWGKSNEDSSSEWEANKNVTAEESSWVDEKSLASGDEKWKEVVDEKSSGDEKWKEVVNEETASPAESWAEKLVQQTESSDGESSWANSKMNLSENPHSEGETSWAETRAEKNNSESESLPNSLQNDEEFLQQLTAELTDYEPSLQDSHGNTLSIGDTFSIEINHVIRSFMVVRDQKGDLNQVVNQKQGEVFFEEVTTNEDYDAQGLADFQLEDLKQKKNVEELSFLTENHCILKSHKIN